MTSNSVAIVGIACRFPKASTLDQFWDLLINGKSGISTNLGERIKWPNNLDTLAKQQSINYAGILDQISEFDNEFFSISPKEAKYIDPQQRILLELAWETLENAGYRPSSLRGKSIGVYIGACSYDYRELLVKETKKLGSYFVTGSLVSTLANRISYFFDFKGPSLVIDTACSSSLVAIYQALYGIRNQEIETALVGGISLIATPINSLAYQKIGILSKEGCCKTFDAEADGFVRGEGGALILIKSLKQAILDNDHIYGIICGGAVNHGGRANNLSAPNPQAQGDLIVKALKESDLTVANINYIEAHGTGTPLGDPLEIEGIKMAFKQFPKVKKDHCCFLGSVKTNLGHLEAASGIAGLIKVIFSMKYGLIPKNLNFKSLNPYIDLRDSCLKIANEKVSWPICVNETNQSLRYGSVSSFGLCGVNAHMILGSFHPKTLVQENEEEVLTKQIFPFSANEEKSLRGYLKKFCQYIEQKSFSPAEFKNIAFTLQIGRESLKYRSFFIASSFNELRKEIKNYLNDQRREYHEESKFTKLAMKWQEGEEIDWREMWLNQKRERIPLPTYYFLRKHFWIV